ncbi:rhoGEF domain-containing protein gxcJ [Tetranychus urticae]|uniref:DH domain-containing protein n=1 Tax=Tetranychus urticae TaxID=32264 RepID=T1KFF3_TETUR|nr:rhoGEF domain-containing protein gxcJ [Tetranychus urticae]
MNIPLGQSCFKKDYQENTVTGHLHFSNQLPVQPQSGIHLTKFESLPRGLKRAELNSVKCQSVENLTHSPLPPMYSTITSSTPPPGIIENHHQGGFINGQLSLRKGLRRLLDKNGTSNGSLKYSHSSHVLNQSSNPTNATKCEFTNGSSSTLSSSSNGSSSLSTGNLMSTRSHSLENGNAKLKDSVRSSTMINNTVNQTKQSFVKTPRSRSSSPHRSLRFKSSIARFIDSNGRLVDCNGRHGLPRKQLKALLPMEDPNINLTYYRQYSPIIEKNGLLTQVNIRTMDSLKENLDIYVVSNNSNHNNNNNNESHNIINNKSVSVKRRPSNLSCSRVLPNDDRLYSPQSVKPFRSVSTLDSRRHCYQSYSGPTTPDREIVHGHGRDLQRKFSDPRLVSDHRDQYNYYQQQQRITKNNYLTYQQYLQHQNKSTMELIRNGARMLWCELPQVRELGLLRELSPAQRQLQEALFEVITSEASYLRSLDILVNHFANNAILSNPAFLDPRRRAELFSNIHVIRDISHNLMNILEVRWRQNLVLTDVCDILVDYAYNHFAPYLTYCRFKRRQESTLRELQLSSKFNTLIRQLEMDPICQGLTLHSFLLLPVQRVTRYPLLVEAILRRLPPDSAQYRSCKRTLFATDKLVKECNTAANQYDKYLDLTSKLKFTSNNMKGLSINEPRWLIMNVEVTRLKPETQSNLLIGTFRAPHWSNSVNVLSILSDMVLLSKKKGDELTVYDYCFRDLVQMRKVGLDTNERTLFNCKLPETYKNLVKMTFLHNNCGKRIEYCLNFNSISERDECLSILDPKTNFIRTEQFMESSCKIWEDSVKHQQQQTTCCPNQHNGCQNGEYGHEIYI